MKDNLVLFMLFFVYMKEAYGLNKCIRTDTNDKLFAVLKSFCAKHIYA